MTHVFGEGSELRGRVEEILNQMQTKIIFRQGGSNIDMLSRLVPDLSEDERRVIPTLPQGLGVWRVGAEHPRMVRALAGPTLSAPVRHERSEVRGLNRIVFVVSVYSVFVSPYSL